MSGDFDVTIDISDLLEQARKLEGGPELVADEMTATMQASLDTFQQLVAAETPVNLGLLRSSITTQIHGRPMSGFYGEVTTPSVYGEPVEYGRKPGKMPPVDAIEYWVVRKGLAPQGPESRQVAFLIARAIGARGTKGAHMFEKGFEQGLGPVVAHWQGMTDRIAEKLAVK